MQIPKILLLFTMLLSTHSKVGVTYSRWHILMGACIAFEAHSCSPRILDACLLAVDVGAGSGRKQHSILHDALNFLRRSSDRNKTF